MPSASALEPLRVPAYFLLTSRCGRYCGPPTRCPITMADGRGAPRKSISRFAARSTPARSILGRCAVQWLDDDPEVEAARQRYRESEGDATASLPAADL